MIKFQYSDNILIYRNLWISRGYVILRTYIFLFLFFFFAFIYAIQNKGHWLASHLLPHGHLPSSTIVHTRFNDNWMFVSFFYYCHYYFILVFFQLVLYSTKCLYNNLTKFLFCKYISSHPTSICLKLVLLPGTLLLTLSISWNKFLLVEIPGTKHLTFLVVVDFLLKRVYVLDI